MLIGFFVAGDVSELYSYRTEPNRFNIKGSSMKSNIIKFFICANLIPSLAFSLTTSDLKNAPASDLIIGMQTACDNGNKEDLLRLHSKRIKTLLQKSPNSNEIMSMYCPQVKEVIDRLGGEPKNGVYFIRNHPRIPNKFELCITTKNAPDSCKMSADVIIEDGILKKDEL